MMKQPYFISFSCAVVGLIVVGILGQSTTLETTTPQTSHDRIAKIPLNGMSEPIEVLSLKRQHKELSVAAVSTAENLADLAIEAEQVLLSPWQATSQNNALALEQQIATDEYQTVDFNPTMYLDIGEGDDIEISLPGGETLVVTVTGESLNDNGDFTWQGQLSQSGQQFPVVMTQGQFGTFGSIATEQGTYTVTTTKTGVGVIYKNPPLPEGHGDDFLEVPITS